MQLILRSWLESILRRRMLSGYGFPDKITTQLAKTKGTNNLDGLKLGQILERKIRALLVLANDLEIGGLGAALNNHHLELF